jgi:predicted signal transduction protein with EAL and GGDEF domain
VPVVLEGREVVVTPSIGIAMTPEAGSTPMALIKNADVAMYEAKQRGRNCYRFYEEGMADQTMVRLDLEGALFRALGNDELRVFYQPQVRLDSGEIVGMEALLRWEHAQLGLIPPGDFIPLAEETGQIVAMGEWVLRTAIQQAAQWRQAGVPVRVSVNVAVQQVAKGGFDTLVAALLHEHALPAALLELEVTETALISEGEVVATLARPRSACASRWTTSAPAIPRWRCSSGCPWTW